MNVLVDTSVWSLALRRAVKRTPPEAAVLRQLIGERRVRMIGPIRQALLSGVREQAQFKRLESHLAAFPDQAVTMEDYVNGARYFNQFRKRGIQGSNTDFLICAVAARQGWAIYTTDRDFGRFARVLPIELFRA